jgi:hypothetical protein
MPETEAQRKKRLEQSGAMIGAAQGPLTLRSGGSIPAFPTNFSNINPEQRTNPIRFGGGGTAAMGLGGANVEYPSRLTLSGGDYGPREMGARDFAPAALPQARPAEMMNQMYTNPFATRSQRMGENLTLGLTQLPPTERLPIGEGPLSMNVTAPRSAEAQGRQAIQAPRGTLYATEEQAANMMTPRTLAQQGTRSPAEQQALLAQMRERGQQIAQNYGQTMQNFAADRRQNQQLYTTPLGAAIAPPTNRFGQPIGEFQQRYAQREQGIKDQAATSSSMLAATPFGMRTNQQMAGGPQPATQTFPRPSSGGPATMGVGTSPFSLTPFARREQEQPSPTAGFVSALNPTPVDRRFRPMPFGMRSLGVI